jgi:hypothetical protein
LNGSRNLATANKIGAADPATTKRRDDRLAVR